jgi:hypothetical protein
MEGRASRNVVNQDGIGVLLSAVLLVLMKFTGNARYVFSSVDKSPNADR